MASQKEQEEFLQELNALFEGDVPQSDVLAGEPVTDPECLARDAAVSAMYGRAHKVLGPGETLRLDDDGKFFIGPDEEEDEE